MSEETTTVSVELLQDAYYGLSEVVDLGLIDDPLLDTRCSNAAQRLGVVLDHVRAERRREEGERESWDRSDTRTL